MADSSKPWGKTIARCESCNFDLSKSRSATCIQCDKTFNADLTDEGGDQNVSCPDCGDSSDIVLIREEPMMLCKRCLDEAVKIEDTRGSTQISINECQDSSNRLQQEVHRTELRCTTCGACNRENLFLVNFSDFCWTARCFQCQLNFDVKNDFAACPNCGESAGELKAPEESGMMICRQCSTLIHDTETGGFEAGSAAATATPADSNHWMQTCSNELWRFVGCTCGNHEPDCFQLIKASHNTKSLYCRDCQQPYSAFLWDNEMPGGQCPRCDGPNVETDVIDEGDAMIQCLKCDGKVSMCRYENHLTDIRQEVINELEINGGQTRDSAHHQPGNTVCLHCGETGAELAASWHNGEICMIQICDKCGCAEPLAKLDATAGEEQQKLQEQMQQLHIQQTPATPVGFEELNHNCGRLDHLHPIENDSGDNLLICDLCSDIICLANCNSAAIPKSVSALRRQLKDTFSSGEMGLPYRTVKIEQLEELKPGDQLEFRRALYSHHGIAVEVLTDKQEIAVVEYTGQSDAPTVVACLSSAPNKAHVARSLYTFKDIVGTLHRVDYHSLDCFKPSMVIERALKRFERKEENYNVGTSNCEHFSIWAKSDLDLSRQVDNFKAKCRKVLEHPVIASLGANAAKGSYGYAMEVLEDIRKESLRLLCMKEGSSSQLLRSILRLSIKWGIRIIVPFGVRRLASVPAKYRTLVDKYVAKPLAQYAANKLVPYNDDETREKESSASGLAQDGSKVSQDDRSGLQVTAVMLALLKR